MDTLTKGERSKLMAKVRGHGNRSTEILLLKLFRQNKITGWRRHLDMFGKPDFIFPKSKLAIFVDGCFWHGCPKHGTQPAGNRSFWKRKFARNKDRDRLVSRILRAYGWQVVRIWEHELARKNEARLLNRIQRAMGKS